MLQELIVTDLTRMGGDKVCIAGLSQNKHIVRPELSRGSIREHHLYKGDQVIIRPGAVVAMDLEPFDDNPAPHTEDHLWSNTADTQFRILAPSNVWQNVLRWTSFPTVAEIFESPLVDGKAIQPGTGARSLGTIKPKFITEFQYEPDRFDQNKYKYRLTFEDEQGNEYRYVSVTDLAVRTYCDYLRVDKHWTFDRISDYFFEECWADKEIWLRIGLARPFSPRSDRNELCYLQVNGIYTFPDYLDGKCFADFLNRNSKRG